jgi:hypothetical protein
MADLRRKDGPSLQQQVSPKVPQKKNSMRQNRAPLRERSFRGLAIEGGTKGVKLDEYGIPLILDDSPEKKGSTDGGKQFDISRDEYGIPLLDSSRQPAKSSNQSSETRQQATNSPHQRRDNPRTQPLQQAYPYTQPYYYPQYPGGGSHPGSPYQQQQAQYPYGYPDPQQQQQYARAVPHSLPLPQSPQRQPESKKKDPSQAIGLEDPEVKAFMEKRRQKQQQLKELALQKEMIEEARRLHISPESLISPSVDHSSRQSPVPPVSANRAASNRRAVEPVAISQPNSTRNTVNPTPKLQENMHNNFNFPSPSEARPVGVFPVPSPRSIPAPAPGPEVIADISHILHPSNLVAYKASSALFQLARKHPTVATLPADSSMIAATQLAGMWMNQVAFYVTRMETSRSANNTTGPDLSSHQGHPSPRAQQSQSATPTASGVNSSTPAGIKRLSSKASFRKDVIDGMSAVLGERVLRTSSQDKVTSVNYQRSMNRSSSTQNVKGAGPSPDKYFVTPTGMRKSRSNDSHEKKNTSGKWECPVCTLLNKSNFLVCEACGTTRPQ